MKTFDHYAEFFDLRFLHKETNDGGWAYLPFLFPAHALDAKKGLHSSWQLANLEEFEELAKQHKTALPRVVLPTTFSDYGSVCDDLLEQYSRASGAINALNDTIHQVNKLLTARRLARRALEDRLSLLNLIGDSYDRYPDHERAMLSGE